MSEQAVLGVITRLDEWRKVLGEPMAPYRANPDNDLIYLLSDAKECIEGLRREARSLEGRTDD